MVCLTFGVVKCATEGRNSDCDEDSYDCNNNQQLSKGEPPAYLTIFSCENLPFKGFI